MVTQRKGMGRGRVAGGGMIMGMSSGMVRGGRRIAEVRVIIGVVVVMMVMSPGRMGRRMIMWVGIRRRRSMVVGMRGVGGRGRETVVRVRVVGVRGRERGRETAVMKVRGVGERGREMVAMKTRVALGRERER